MANLTTLFRCEAAGRKNNEDNGKILKLGNNNGVLLIVCDGMGGLNAGEVASALAVATIENWFTPKRLTPAVLQAPLDYLKQSIVGADANIKIYSKKHPETEGMGSTIVMAWLLGKKVYVAWLGDSRAYRFNPQLGLERLSHDHSLVQSWIDAGNITEEQAFIHPQSNIITRSLGDPKSDANPDGTEYTIYNNDIFLLCSDGLCGLLRDSEIEQILTEATSLTQCCDQLWQASEAAQWHDNVTTAMAQVSSGGSILSTVQSDENEAHQVETIEGDFSDKKGLRPTPRIIKNVLTATLLICAVVFAFLYFAKDHYLGTIKDGPYEVEFPGTSEISDLRHEPQNGVFEGDSTKNCNNDAITPSTDIVGEAAMKDFGETLVDAPQTKTKVKAGKESGASATSSANEHSEKQISSLSKEKREENKK